MNLILTWLKNNPIRSIFLIPIFLVAFISVTHVVAWYSLSNPISWAIYLSIAIEVAAMIALVAATNKIKGGVWLIFTLVTFIQMIGNIFFSYKEIDSDGELFKSWVELTAPVWEMLGSDINDVVSLKRWLAFLEGGLLPIISLTALHFFVKYDELDLENKKVTDKIVNEKKNESEDLNKPVEKLVNVEVIESNKLETESIIESEVVKIEDDVKETIDNEITIESETIKIEEHIEEIIDTKSQDVPDTNVEEITKSVDNIDVISEEKQIIGDNNLSNLDYVKKMFGLSTPITQTIEPEIEIESENMIEHEINDSEIFEDKVRLTYTKNS